jgi:hypothetical protein
MKEPTLPFKTEGSLLTEFLLACGRTDFVRLRPSIYLDETSPQFGGKFALLKYTDLNINLTLKLPHRNIE